MAHGPVQDWACSLGCRPLAFLGRLEGCRPLSVLHPQVRPLMRVSPGGVFLVYASAKPYSDCLVSLWSYTNRAIPVGSAFGRIGLQLFSCSGSTETVKCGLKLL